MPNYTFETKKEMIDNLIEEAASAFVTFDMEALDKILSELDRISFDPNDDIKYLKDSSEVLRKIIEFYKSKINRINNPSMRV